MDVMEKKDRISVPDKKDKQLGKEVETAQPKTLRERYLKEMKDAEEAGHPVIPVTAHLPPDADEPFPEAPEPKELTEEEKALKKQKEELLKKIDVVLKKYNYNESSVPPNSEYWGLVAELRALNNP